MSKALIAIRKILREELEMFKEEIIQEILSSNQPILQEQSGPKRKSSGKVYGDPQKGRSLNSFIPGQSSKPTKKFTSNPTLQQILEETTPMGSEQEEQMYGLEDNEFEINGQVVRDEIGVMDDISDMDFSDTLRIMEESAKNFRAGMSG